MQRLVAAFLVLACLPLEAETPPVLRPELEAARLDTPPVLDGEILEDPAWRGVPVETSFTQNTPDDGAPASQRTELRVAYDADALYVAFVCHDEDPGQIVISDARRDGDLGDTDSVRLILDTYLDEQNGFVFGTQPTTDFVTVNIGEANIQNDQGGRCFLRGADCFFAPCRRFYIVPLHPKVRVKHFR